VEGPEAGRLAIGIAERLHQGIGKACNEDEEENGKPPRKVPKPRDEGAAKACGKPLSEQYAARCSGDASKARVLIGQLKANWTSSVLLMGLTEDEQKLATLATKFQEATKVNDDAHVRALVEEAKPGLEAIKASAIILNH